MKKVTTWLLIANGTEARLVCNDGPGRGFSELDEHLPKGPNLPAREIMADRPGRTFDSVGKGRHGKEPPTDPREVEMRRFLSQVADRLNQAATQGSYDHLVLIAPPKALGLLRQELGGNAQGKLVAQLDKDLTKVALGDLPDHLQSLALA